MKSYELLREILSRVPASVVAEHLRLKPGIVYKWGEQPGDDKSGALNPLDRVAGLVKCSQDDRIAHWVCEQANGFFVPNTRTRTLQKSPTQATSEIVQDFADMLQVIAQAAIDNAISPRETEEIRRRWEELKTVAETFVLCCEQGDFAKLAEEVATAAVDQRRRGRRGEKQAGKPRPRPKQD